VAAADFKDLDTRIISGVPYYLLQENTSSLDPAKLPRFTLRESAEAETPLPLPGDCALLRDFELDGIEINTFGTVRVFPKHPVIDGTVFWQGGGNEESPPLPLMQRLNDRLKRLREDFFLWKNRPANCLTVSLVMFGIGIALAAFVARRLWRSRRRLESGRRGTGYAGTTVRTPLHGLETSTRKILGERPPGQTFAHWFARLRTTLGDIDALDEAIALHQCLRFDPAPPRAADLERLARLTARLEATIKTRARFPTRQSGHFP
jgi:hypothetical protein